ncbi:MAG: hypothetical protein WBL28_07455 [Methylotenera sp.]
MGSPPSKNPLLYASNAVSEPVIAALAYGQRAVDQGIDVAGVTPEPMKAKPKAQSPRIAELVRTSKREIDELKPDYDILLSTKAHPDSGGAEGNRPLIYEYKDLRQDLKNYVNAASQGRVEDFELTDWSQRLWRTGDDRIAITNNLLCHFRGMLNNGMKRLQEQESTLTKHKQAFDRIRKAIAEIKTAKAAIETIVIVYDAIEVAEKTIHAIAHGTVVVLPAQIGGIVAQSTIIKGGVAKIADYMIQLSIVTESLAVGGYTSLEGMKNSINAILENISDELKLMRSYEEDKFKAQVLNSIPAVGKNG